MADYRCGNCGGFPNCKKDCPGVLKQTCAACGHSLHNKYQRGKRSIECGDTGYHHPYYAGKKEPPCTCVDSEVSEWDKLNNEVIWI